MTTREKHHKHPPLTRRKVGKYHRNEWAIYGATCDRINTVASEIINSLSDVNILWVDADHSHPQQENNCQVGEKLFVNQSDRLWNHFDDKILAEAHDAVFVNGNHYPADQQIVIIDPKKRESLLRRLDQLTNVVAVILPEDQDEIFDFIQAKMNEATSVYRISELGEVTRTIKSYVQSNSAPLRALVLAGGKSQRMGIDKSQITYHEGRTQEEHLIHMLSNVGLDVCRSKGYDYLVKEEVKVISDKFIDLGPFGAILSAMMTDPTAAWLVLACDLPFIDEESILRLMDGRDSGKFATAYKVTDQPFPEPLIAIYEPKMYSRMLSFLALGYACPRKVLINSEIKTIDIDPRKAKNINTPEEMKAAKLTLSNE